MVVKKLAHITEPKTHQNKIMKYIFYIPEYNDISNGIALLWQAAYHFSKYREVRIWPYGYGYSSSIPIKYKDLDISDRPIGENDIVIYPENIEGNPINAERICRYFMAKPYILNGAPVNYDERDFIFAYSHAINRRLPQYNLANENFTKTQEYASTTKISGKVTIYYGKCRFARFSKDVIKILINAKSVELLTRFHPSSKDDLYRAIASSEIFISVDPLTSLIYESTLLGTPALVADPVFREEYDQYNHPLHGFCYSNEELKKVKSIKLAELTQKEYEQELSKNLEKTKIIINAIENFFGNCNVSVNKKSLLRTDKEFYALRWNCSPIFNVTSFKSIIAWHTIRCSPTLFSLAFFVLSVPKLLRSTIAKNLHPIVLDLYRSMKKRDAIFRELHEHSPSDVAFTKPANKVIPVNKWLLVFFWSL